MEQLTSYDDPRDQIFPQVLDEHECLKYDSDTKAIMADVDPNQNQHKIVQRITTKNLLK